MWVDLQSKVVLSAETEEEEEGGVDIRETERHFGKRNKREGHQKERQRQRQTKTDGAWRVGRD